MLGSYSRRRAGGRNYLVKYNTAGDMEMDTFLNVQSHFFLAMDTAGFVYVATQRYQTLFIRKYSGSGDEQRDWLRKHFITSTSLASPRHACRLTSVVVDQVGDVVISGRLLYREGNKEWKACFLAKSSGSGDLTWKSSFNMSVRGYCWSVATDTTGNVYLLQAENGSPSTSAFRKWNSTGNALWHQPLGPNRIASSLAIDGENNIYISGYHSSANSIFLKKYDSFGSAQWERSASCKYVGSASSSKEAFVFGSRTFRSDALTIDSAGHVLIGGLTRCKCDNQTIATKIYSFVRSYSHSGKWQRTIEHDLSQQLPPGRSWQTVWDKSRVAGLATGTSDDIYLAVDSLQDLQENFRVSMMFKYSW